MFGYFTWIDRVPSNSDSTSISLVRKVNAKLDLSFSAALTSKQAANLTSGHFGSTSKDLKY